MARPAGIEYLGAGGTTRPCVEAVVKVLQSTTEPFDVLILTHETQRVPPANDLDRPRVIGRHCLLIRYDEFDRAAVKSGFSSGYGGAGPTGFSNALALLVAHGIKISETIVNKEILDRVDHCLLTGDDLEAIEAAPTVPWESWRDYIYKSDTDAAAQGQLWRQFPLVVPFAVVDAGLMDLALTFWQNPNDRLRTAFVRLEEQVRIRSGLTEHGATLFKQAFLPLTASSQPILRWAGVDEKEQAARASLFESAFRAHRNPRAHRELSESPPQQLSEFLLVNHLFGLLRDAKRTKRRNGQQPR